MILLSESIPIFSDRTVERFDSVSKNTIHRVNFEKNTRVMGEMGSLLYPGSLSTVSGNQRKQLPLFQLVDFENKQVIRLTVSIFSGKHFLSMISFQTRNQLSILNTKCPKILHKTLAEAYPMQAYIESSIIQLSYENYDVPEHGRKHVSAGTLLFIADRKRLSYLFFFLAVFNGRQ